MNSSTSASKRRVTAFGPWIVAFGVFCGIESVVQFVAHPNEFDRTNFLQFSFARQETPQRAFVYQKVRAFADSRPVIVQSGDSSGFYGIEPARVKKHLPQETTYLNMSCCANLGYSGYYNLLKFMAERNESIRYIVLYITPYTMPRPELWYGDGAALWQDPTLKVFGADVDREFLSLWRVFHVPSLAYRRAVTEFVYYLSGQFAERGRPLIDNPNYLHFMDLYRRTLGWMPESDRRESVPSTECQVIAQEFFAFGSLSWKTYLEEILERYAELARNLNVTLVVVFQPVACTLGTGKGSAKAREGIARFKTANPDVEIPFPLIETWPSERFSVPAHVKHEHTSLLGDRLGTSMAEIIQRRERSKADPQTVRP